MTPHLDHIGIAVDAENLANVLHDLIGAIPYKQEAVKRDHITTHFISAGTAKLELLQADDAASPVADFIKKRGEGLHHLAFDVDDLDAMIEHARRLGYRPLEPAPRKGADGKIIFFLHPKDTAGVLIEFCQINTSILGPPSTVAAMEVRSAGSHENPSLAYVYDGSPNLDQDPLARRLEQQFYFHSIRSTPTRDLLSLADSLSIAPTHLAAEGDLIVPALAAASHERSALNSVILIDPTETVVETAKTLKDSSGRIPTPPALILATADNHLRPAILLRDLLQAGSLAAVAHADLCALLIERHASGL